MIKISNHIGTVTVSKKYLVKLVTEQVESCFGVAGLKSVEICRRGSALDVRLAINAAGDVNIPAVADAVSHKVAYVLVHKTGAQVRSVQIYTDDLV
jgi:uncharacterized alkaline shock family protein YloU